MKLSLQMLQGNFMSLATHPGTGTADSFLNVCVCVCVLVAHSCPTLCDPHVHKIIRKINLAAINQMD